MSQQNSFRRALARNQTTNDKSFYALENGIKATLESLQKINTVVGGQMKILKTDLLEIKCFLAVLYKYNIHLRRSTIFAQQIRYYFELLGTLHTQVRFYRAAFYAYKMAIFYYFVTSRWLCKPCLSFPNSCLK